MFIVHLIRNFYPTVGEFSTKGCHHSYEHKLMCPDEVRAAKIHERMQKDGWDYSHINFWGDRIWVKGFKKQVEHVNWGR